MHADGGSLEGRGYIRHRQPFAHGGEQYQHQGKAHRGPETIEQGLQEVVVLVDVEQGTTISVNCTTTAMTRMKEMVFRYSRPRGWSSRW
jgi:hypothetical protein